LALFLLLPLASARAQDALLEGTGKNAVQTYCVQCHDLSQGISLPDKSGPHG
jgi:mono/diheme cytochrome c family protein